MSPPATAAPSGTAPLRRRPDRSGDDRCPGVRRPWPADDGLLVRVRLAGGRLDAPALTALSQVARQHGDGDLHLTGRANLQLRALPAAPDGGLDPAVASAVAATGLLPSRSHELVRNLMASPQTGLGGGRADLRPVLGELDRLLCADPAAATLSGRFLLVLDDGRGDLVERPCDLGAVALDDRSAQLRVGPAWGEVVALGEVPEALVRLVRAFLEARPGDDTGESTGDVWHVAELDAPLATARPVDPRLPAPAGPAAYGVVAGGEHVPAPDGVLSPALVDELTARAAELVVTPWRGVLVPRPADLPEEQR